jgi:excisionase family DNA binding protein
MARTKSVPRPEDLLTIREVCAIYKCSKPTVYRWANDGLVTLWKVGASTRVDRNEIEKRVIRRAVAS